MRHVGRTSRVQVFNNWVLGICLEGKGDLVSRLIMRLLGVVIRQNYKGQKYIY